MGTTALLNSFERVTQQFGETPAPHGAGGDHVDDVQSVLERIEQALCRQRRRERPVTHLALEPGSEAAHAGRMVQLREQPILDGRPHPIHLLLVSFGFELA
jgi:hypothetical protein